MPRTAPEQLSLDDLIHEITYNPRTRYELFDKLPPERRAVVLLKLSKHIQKQLVKSLTNDKLVETLNHMDPDEIRNTLKFLNRWRSETIINKLSQQIKDDLGFLSEFDPQTASGIMQLDYIQVEESMTVEHTVNRLKEHEKNTGRVPLIISTKDGEITGYVPMEQLAIRKISDPIRVCVHKIIKVQHDTPSDKVIDLFKLHPHNKAVVTGHNGNIMGVIYSDDILRIIEDSENSSLYNFAGVNDEELVFDSANKKIKRRYKWLIINLGTAFLASSVVGLFNETISKYVLLAVYMPIVAGMGGNAATQTLVVLVRGIALNQISLKTALPTLRKELTASFVNGLLNGLIVAAIVLIINRDVMIALILALAMIANLLVAAFFGTLVPLIMKKLNKDPAASATIFITTATDVLGFLCFLGLATILLD